MTFSVLNPVYFSGTYHPKLFVVWDSVGQLHHFSVLSFKCSSLWLLWQYYFLPTSVAKPSLCLFWFLLPFFWKMCAFPKAVPAIHFFFQLLPSQPQAPLSKDFTCFLSSSSSIFYNSHHVAPRPLPSQRMIVTLL